MENFSPKLNIESKNIDPYFKWQTKMAKEGKTNIGELEYIHYALGDNGDNEDVERALGFAHSNYESREDLIADLFIKKGDFVNAKELIVNVKKEDLYEAMIDSLEELILKKPDMKEDLMNEIAIVNPKFFASIPKELLNIENE